MFKNASDFFANVTGEQLQKINPDKYSWYKEREYMAYSTRMFDFYTDAKAQGLISNKRERITVDNFKKYCDEISLE